MPLTRGQIVGHDTERLAFRFTMLNDGETVQCQISDAAMDELAGMQGTENTARPLNELRPTCLTKPPPFKVTSFGYSRNI